MKEFKMPKLGHVMEDGIVSEWLIGVGDSVSKGDVILKVETEKSVLDVESPFDGILKEITIEAGETVPVGTVIALFE